MLRNRAILSFAPALLLIVGCASRPSQEAQPLPIAQVDDGAVTASLAFDPPVQDGQMLADTSREDRERAAFVAFEEMTTSFSYIRTHDRQVGHGRGGRFEREAIIEKVGVSYR